MTSSILTWMCPCHIQDGRYYDFYQNEQRVRSDIAHFQVREQCWHMSVLACHCMVHRARKEIDTSYVNGAAAAPALGYQ